MKLAELHPRKLAKKMEQQKVQEHQAFCQRNGWRFLPFVVETIGGFDEDAKQSRLLLNDEKT